MSSACQRCQEEIEWVDCPTGGWWAHRVHPTDNHDVMTCRCGEGDCPNFDAGYPWCRPHGEHHRPPECPVDECGTAAPWWEQPGDGS